MRHLIVAAVLVAVVAGCGRENEKPVATPSAPIKLQKGDAAAGKVIAERECKGCHGMDGRGTAPAIPHLAAQTERYLYESSIEYREGKRVHAALKDMTGHMSEADVRGVVAYYANLPPLQPSATVRNQPLSP
jgi:cytochrome c553